MFPSSDPAIPGIPHPDDLFEADATMPSASDTMGYDAQYRSISTDSMDMMQGDEISPMKSSREIETQRSDEFAAQTADYTSFAPVQRPSRSSKTGSYAGLSSNIRPAHANPYLSQPEASISSGWTEPNEYSEECQGASDIIRKSASSTEGDLFSDVEDIDSEDEPSGFEPTEIADLPTVASGALGPDDDIISYATGGPDYERSAHTQDWQIRSDSESEHGEDRELDRLRTASYESYPNANSPTESQLIDEGFEFHNQLPESKQAGQFLENEAFRDALKDISPDLPRKQQWYAWRKVMEMLDNTQPGEEELFDDSELPNDFSLGSLADHSFGAGCRCGGDEGKCSCSIGHCGCSGCPRQAETDAGSSTSHRSKAFAEEEEQQDVPMVIGYTPITPAFPDLQYHKHMNEDEAPVKQTLPGLGHLNDDDSSFQGRDTRPQIAPRGSPDTVLENHNYSQKQYDRPIASPQYAAEYNQTNNSSSHRDNGPPPISPPYAQSDGGESHEKFPRHSSQPRIVQPHARCHVDERRELHQDQTSRFPGDSCGCSCGENCQCPVNQCRCEKRSNSNDVGIPPETTVDQLFEDPFKRPAAQFQPHETWPDAATAAQSPARSELREPREFEPPFPQIATQLSHSTMLSPNDAPTPVQGPRSPESYAPTPATPASQATSRPDTPRPRGDTYEYGVRQSVEPELPSPISHRQSTPAYEDRSATPSPISQQIPSDTSMHDATPTQPPAMNSLEREGSVLPDAPPIEHEMNSPPGSPSFSVPPVPAVPAQHLSRQEQKYAHIPVPPMPTSPTLKPRKQRATSTGAGGGKRNTKSAVHGSKIGKAQPKQRNVTRKATGKRVQAAVERIEDNVKKAEHEEQAESQRVISGGSVKAWDVEVNQRNGSPPRRSARLRDRTASPSPLMDQLR